MKTVVSVQEISELEIKPHSEVSEWRQLVESEIDTLSEHRSSWINVPCPCCSGDLASAAFTRIGIDYVECSSCGTVYAPERPGEDTLRYWYRDSAAARFWRKQILVASHDMRHQKIVLPRAQWVMDGIAEYVPSATQLLDLSSNGRSLVDVILAETPKLKASVVGPAADLESKPDGRVSVEPTPVDELVNLGPVDLVTALDTFDRAADFPALVNAVHDVLAPGGVLYATLLMASGFEIQSLWDRSPSVLPPDKLNLPTVNGLLQAFASPSWEVLELSTPGMFDVEIVRRTIADLPDVPWPRVLRALVEETDTEKQQRFMEYLQSRRLSSFARLVVRRVD